MNSSFHKTSQKLPLQFHPAVLVLILALLLFFNLNGFSQASHDVLAFNQISTEYTVAENNIELPSQDDLSENLIDLEAELAELERQIEIPVDDMPELENMILEATDNVLEEDNIVELEDEVSNLEIEGDLGQNDVEELNKVIEDQAKELIEAYQEIEALKAILEHTDLDLVIID